MRLRRLTFESIGHRDARLAPLVLDFTGDGAPLDTVMWLRNGGGKSSILNLFFGLLRPGRRDFLGSEAEGRDRRLEDYVMAQDTAHVVAEWEIRADGALPGMPAAQLVTGMVLEWKDRTRSSDPSRLRRAWYAFWSKPGGLTLDNLPVTLPASNGNGAGRRVTSLTAFVDILREASRTDPSIELTVSDTQSDWQRRLTDVGLDPELFRYQIRMNSREGTAHELFRFRDSAQFIDFLLELVMDPAEPAEVAANLRAFSEELARRPQLEVERSFVEGALSALQPLAEAVERQSAAAGSLEEAWTAADRGRRSFLAAAELHRAAQAEQARLAEAKKEEVRQHDFNRRRLGELAAELRRVAANFRLGSALKRQDEVSLLHSQAEALIVAWRAADLLARRRSAAAALAALDEQLHRAEKEVAPLRAQRAEAGRRLARRLDHLRAEATERARAAAARANKAEVEFEACSKMIGELMVERKGVEDELAEGERRCRKAAERRSVLESAGTLSSGESAEDALARLDAEDGQLSASERSAETALASIRDRRRRFEAARLDGAKQLAEKQHRRAQVDQDIEDLCRRRDAIAADPFLAELAETDEFDVWAAGAVVAERLSLLVAQADADLVALEIEGLEDRRALFSLDETGLLPPTPDVERVLEALTRAGVPAFAGFRHIAESVGDRDGAIRGRPDLAAGIVIASSARLEEARKALDASGVVLSTAVVVGAAEGFESTHESNDGFVVAPARALFDSAAAPEERSAKAVSVQTLDTRRAQLKERRGLNSDRLVRLQSFLSEFPETTLAAWEADGERLKTDAHNLEERMQQMHGQLEALDSERSGIEDRQKETGRRRRCLAGVLADVAGFAALNEEAMQLEGSRERLVLRVEELNALVGQTTGERQSWRRRLADASSFQHENELQADRLAGERAGMDVEVAEGSGREPLGEEDLDSLRARYQTLDQKYKGLVSDNVLADRRGRAAGQVAELDGELANEEFAAARDTAQAIASDPANDDPSVRAAGLRRAREAEREAFKQKVLAEQAAETARAKVAELAPAESRRPDLPADLSVADAGQADQRADELSRESTAASEQATAAQKDAEAAERAAETAGMDAERMQSLAQHLATVLSAKTPTVVEATGEPSTDPFGGSIAEARINEDSLRRGLDAAFAAYEQATKRVVDLADAVRRYCLAEKFESVKGKIKDRLTRDPAEELAAQAAGHSEALKTRLDQLVQQLDKMDQHQDLIVRELAGLVDTALGHLKRAETSSRLPEALEGWAARTFLRISFQQPERDEDLFARLGTVVDRIVAEGSVPEGLPLLLSAVHAAAGAKGFDVTILKPDTTLRSERHPIAELAKFSDGQQLTAAILLYCTLARLRARNRGRAGASSGVLILDNPIGTCSNIALLDLQRRVAAAMGIQLVYTTGVNDLDALATLPNCIRLRNDRIDARTGRNHVIEEDAAPATLASARVFYREPR